MRLSTVVLVVGIALLFVPLPPVATIAGVLTILLGVVLRVVFGI